MCLRIKAQILFVAFSPSWSCLLLQPHPSLLHVNFKKAGCLPAYGLTDLMCCFQLHAFPRTSWLHFCCGLIHLPESFALGNPPEPSVQVSRSVVSSSLRPHGLQHARLPCTSPTPRAYWNSSPLSQRCHPTISSSIIPFSSHLQSFPASESFPMSQFFASDGQSIGVSASASVLLMNIQDWFPLGLIGWISLQSKGLSRVFSNTIVQKHQFFILNFLYSPTLTSIHDYWKNHNFD